MKIIKFLLYIINFLLLSPERGEVEIVRFGDIKRNIVTFIHSSLDRENEIGSAY